MSNEMSAETKINDETKNEGAPAMSDNTSAQPELRYIAVTMTPELLAAIDKECAETNVSRGGLLKQIVCSHFGLEVAAKAPRHAKYNSDEERAEAKKAQTASRNLKIRALLKMHQNGGDVSKLTDEERAAIA